MDHELPTTDDSTLSVDDRPLVVPDPEADAGPDLDRSGPPDAPADPLSDPPRSRFRLTAEWVALCLAPLVFYGVYRPEPFHLGNTIDPFLYLGYSWDPKDLIARFGMEYYPVRFGLTLPIDLFTRVFGVEGGYFALRYALALLAVVPLYAYVRASKDRGLAALAVLLYLTSPMLLRALLSSYSDTTALPYLTAGISLLAYTQVRPDRHRLPILFLAGTCLALAVHSNPIVSLLVGIIVVVWSAAELPSRRVRLLLDWTVIGGAAALVTVGGVLLYWYRFDDPDIFSPSIDAATRLSGSDGDAFRAPDYAWLSYRFFLYLPPLVLVCWAIAVARRRSSTGTAARPRRDELTMIVLLATLSAFFVVHEFVLGSSTMESYYYTSYLTGSIVIGLVLLVGALRGPVSGWMRWVPVGVAAALPLIWAAFDRFEFDWNPGLVLVFGGTVVAVALARRWPVLAVGSVVIVLVANQLLLFNAPGNPPLSPGQTFRFDPHYEAALDNPSQTLSWYEMSHQLTEIMPPLTSTDGTLLFWYDDRQGILSSMQATYRSMPIAWQAGLAPMPSIVDAQMQRLAGEHVGYLVLLAQSQAEIDAGRHAIENRGIHIEDRRPRKLEAPGYVIYVEILRITPLPAPPAG